MNKIIDFFVISFVIDFLIDLLLKSIHGLSVKKWQIFILQLLNVSCSAVYIFCNLQIYQLILIKIFANFVICLLITEEYSKSKIFLMFGSFLLNACAVYGSICFLTEFFKSIIIEIFKVEINELYYLCIFFGELLFIWLIFSVNKNLYKEKKLKQFLSKVSFCLNDKHIEITGLLDSGNSLYDFNSNAPVIVVSMSVLKRVLSKDNFYKFCNGKYEILGKNISFINYVCVGGTQSQMPIVSDIMVEINGLHGKQKHKCSVGFINQNFTEKKFECLIHKDFV